MPDIRTSSATSAEMTALVADIQRMSVDDGPGIRTTVFFKGCPLRCAWCHNPECISFEPQTLFYADKCIHCGKCAAGCYSGARVMCGTPMTARQILDEIIADRDYYGDDGGVTFSGGEPLSRADFLKIAADMCNMEKINCAVETSLIYYNDEIEGIMKKLNLVMADLKIWDDKVHRQYTGVSNEGIKRHFEALNRLGMPIIARTPVIPGIDQGIDMISEFMHGLSNVKKYELLPYHPLGISKKAALGEEPARFEIPSKEYMKELEKYVFIR